MRLFRLDFGLEGVAGAARAGGEDAAAHSARRLSSAIELPLADTQPGWHRLWLILNNCLVYTIRKVHGERLGRCKASSGRLENVHPLGLRHIAWLIGTAATAVLLVMICRRFQTSYRPVCFVLAAGLVGEELFRYAHDGMHFPNRVPIQLCTVVSWMAVLACFRRIPLLIEFIYFAGLPGAALALLTPDLRPTASSYDFIRYFFAHGCLLITLVVLVFGKKIPFRPGAPIRANGMLLVYCFLIMIYNKLFGTNFMYLMHKPNNPTLLDYFGPWPIYILAAEVVAIGLFWLLWLPVRPDGTVME